MSTPSLINAYNPEAFTYEEKLVSTPYDVNLWLQYVDSVDEAVGDLKDKSTSKKVNEAQRSAILLQVRVHGRRDVDG
jgi:hypothetical protein